MPEPKLQYLESCYYGTKVWKLYRNSQGYIEGYRSSRIIGKSVGGNMIAEQMERIVTNTKDPTQFIKYIRPIAHKSNQQPDDPNQLKIM